MAVSGRLDIRHSIDAAVDLSEKQYHFVWYDANGKAVVADEGGPGLILVDKPSRVGEGATVILVGKSKVTLGDAVDAGDFLAADEDGAAVLADEGDTVNALALEAGVTGQVVTCLVLHFPVPVAPVEGGPVT
jgi:hypothetical protein